VFGFAPNRSKARLEWLEVVAETNHAFSFFEAPHRIQQTMGQVGPIFGERPIVVAREVTKLHQEFLRGTASGLSDRLLEPRGEFTVIVGPSVKPLINNYIQLTDSEIASEFWRLTNNGAGSRREVINELAKRACRSPKDIYLVIERAKKLVV
jgi:16S rRNA (cytidine1402-2'-O)-methyltransferase